MKTEKFENIVSKIDWLAVQCDANPLDKKLQTQFSRAKDSLNRMVKKYENEIERMITLFYHDLQ